MNIESKELIVEQTSGVVTISLNRPKVRNALNQNLIVALIQELDKIDDDSSVRMVVLNGIGEHFCAGADLNWMQESLQYDDIENIQDATILATLMRKLNSLSKPTLCVTQGSVYGGGIGLVACCDIIVAAENTKFCFSELKLGLAPAVIEPYIINAIGSKAARRWILTAEIFDATQAEHMGLVNVVASPHKIESTVQKFIDLIRSNAPHATSVTKTLLLQNLDYNDPRSEVVTTKTISKLRASREGKEGISAFLEKRKPRWSTEK